MNVNEGFEESFRASLLAFAHYVRGEAERPSSFLEDTRGYVLVTNAMLLSSGDIFEIPSDKIRCAPGKKWNFSM